MKKQLTILTVFIALATLAGCGTEQNPIKDYSKAKQSVTPEEEKQKKAEQPKNLDPIITETERKEVIPPKGLPPVPQKPPESKIIVQETLTNSAYNIDAPILSRFVEGETGTVNFSYRVQFYADKVKASLKIPNLPKDASFKKVDDKTWQLTWSPDNGTIPPRESSIDGKWSVEFEVETGDAEAKAFYKMVPKSQEFYYSVAKSNKAPTLKVSSLEKSLNEGDAMSFYVDVEDATSYKNNPPTVFAIPETNLKTEKVFYTSAAGFVSIDPTHPEPEMSKAKGSETQWRFYFLYDVSHVVLPMQMDSSGKKPLDGASELKTKFAMRVYGRTGNQSVDEPLEVSIKLKSVQSLVGAKK